MCMSMCVCACVCMYMCMCVHVHASSGVYPQALSTLFFKTEFSTGLELTKEASWAYISKALLVSI